jgi:hypothetical protein
MFGNVELPDHVPQNKLIILWDVPLLFPKDMTEIARETGLSREQHYRSFSERGNPTLKTMIAVMRAVGVDMTAKTHA